MPKMKSRRNAVKSFRLTGTGKVKREKAFRSHILTSKSAKRKRHLRKETLVSLEETKRVRVFLQQ
jgi:large subunit ribosomal protein L35